MFCGLGATDCLRVLGLTKTAEIAVKDVAQAGVIGIAGLAPFAGLIGERSLVNDPARGAVAPQFSSIRQLAEKAHPGDVAVMGRPTPKVSSNPWSFWSALRGASEHHIEPIVGYRDWQGIPISSQQFTKGLSDAHMLDKAPWLQDKGFDDVVLLRPKHVTEAQVQEMSRKNFAGASKPYSYSQALKNALRDMFMPKIKGLTDRSVGPAERNVCSTMSAESFTAATGRPVVPGKAPNAIVPSDFLRSPEFTVVGYHRTRPVALTRFQRFAPTLTRLGLGTALAGTAYGITEYPYETSAAIAGVAGAAAAPRVHYMLSSAPERYPSILKALVVASEKATTAEKRKYLSSLASKWLPRHAKGAVVGIGSVIGTKALIDRVQSLKSKSKSKAIEQ